jgi:hypothetical protein
VSDWLAGLLLGGIFGWVLGVLTLVPMLGLSMREHRRPPRRAPREELR